MAERGEHRGRPLGDSLLAAAIAVPAVHGPEGFLAAVRVFIWPAGLGRLSLLAPLAPPGTLRILPPAGACGGEVCPACHRPFPLPAAKGVEVSASPTHVQSPAARTSTTGRSSMFRAMAIKELRETAGIAALSVLAFLFLVGWAVEANRFASEAFEELPFVDGRFLSWYAILALFWPWCSAGGKAAGKAFAALICFCSIGRPATPPWWQRRSLLASPYCLRSLPGRFCSMACGPAHPARIRPLRMVDDRPGVVLLDVGGARLSGSFSDWPLAGPTAGN